MKRLLRYLFPELDTVAPFVGKLWEWSSLNAMLSNSTARVIYVLPIAGYVILYSDYFQALPLFRFSVLSSWGFLSFEARINMIYYGSIVLLIAFILFWFCCPPLLRNKRDFQQFAGDIIVSRDSSTVHRIMPPTTRYLESLPLDQLDKRMTRSLEIMKRRGTSLGISSGEYEADIPDILAVYYPWQNKRRATRGFLIFCLTIFAYALLIVPSVDLFFRVLGTNLKGHHAAICTAYVKVFQMLRISVEYAACVEWFQR